MEPIELALMQALEGIHHQGISRMERKLNIGGQEYNATIYSLNNPSGMVRIDLKPVVTRDSLADFEG